MEIKKSPKADLRNKRGLLLEIGLAVSLAIVIAAFAYTPKEHRIEKVDLNYAVVEEEITEITRQDQKPPEPPKPVFAEIPLPPKPPKPEAPPKPPSARS